MPALLVSFLALRKGLSQKEIGARSGLPEKIGSYHLRKGDLADESLYERLLTGIEAQPAEVEIVTACIEALTGLEEEGDLTAQERAAVERTVLEAAQLSRPLFIEAVLGSRRAPPPDVYPGPAEVE